MSLRRALAFSYVEKYGAYLVGLVSTVIISRLLGPADIGVFAIGTALVGIVAVVRELGVSTYLVQEAKLSSERIRSAFTLTVGVGVGLALFILLISWPAGAFYGDPRVMQILVILAFGFALTPLGSVSQALLARDMQFGTLTWIRTLHTVTSASVSIGLAMAGFGPVSLAWGSVTAAGVNAIVSLAVRPHPMWPNFSRDDVVRVLAVGGPATVIGIVEDIVGSLPELLLGRMQSLAATGLFSRARGLSQMAHQLIARAAGPVFFTAFATLRREGQSAEPLYVKATACVTVLGWTALAALAVLAEPVVALLYGAAWTEVVPLLRWLCAAAAVALLTSGANHLLLASGGAREAMWAKLAGVPIYAVSLAVGGWFGVEAMAAASVVSAVLGSVLLNVAVKRYLHIGWSAQLSALRVSLPPAISGALGASAGLVVAPAGPAQAFASVVLGGVACSLLAGAVLMAGNHPLKTEVLRTMRGVLHGSSRRQ